MLLARDFREIARDALRGRWGLAVITGLVASLLVLPSASIMAMALALSAEEAMQMR